MSSKEMKSMINTLENWLVTVEEIIENETNHKVFLSNYGKEYYTDFTDLHGIGYLFVLPKAITIFQGKLDDVKNLDQAKNLVLTLLKQIINQEKPKGEKKKLAKDLLSKLDEKADETISILRKEREDYEKIFKNLNDITETPESEQKEDESKESSFTSIVEEMRLFQRVNAYFVIALYAIIEVYCLSFLQDSISKCPKDMVYNSLQKTTPPPSNPVDSLNIALNIQKTNVLKLTDIRTKLIKKLKWEIHQESFISFKDIRKIPAHQKTVLSLDELIERFPKQHSRAEKLFKQVLKELDSDSFPPMIKEPLLEGIDDLKIVLYLREIGNSCLRYLVLHEAVLQYCLYKDSFMEKINEFMDERNKT